MRRGAVLIISLFAAGAVMADAPAVPAGFWVTPAIAGYGRIHPLPQSAFQPGSHQDARIVFALSHAGRTPQEVSGSLDHVARAVNLYVAAGVPLKRLHFVAVAAGDATAIMLDDDHYKSVFGVPNPNLELIALLRKAGVEVTVCGQAVAEHNYDYGWIDRSVTVAESAMTTLATLQQKGYALVML